MTRTRSITFLASATVPVLVTLSLNEGASLPDVQDAVRHADTRMTRRYDRNRTSLNRHPAHRLLSALEP